MATSNNSNFDLTRDQICLSALRMVGGVPGFATANNYSTEISNAAEALEIIIKNLQGNNIFLWTREWTTQPITASSLKTGTDGLYYRCVRSHTSATATNKPITGTDWRSYWQVTSSTGTAWADSQSYVSAGDFTPNADTLKIIQAFVRDSSGGDTPLEILTEEKYLLIPDKWSEAVYPSYLYLDVKLSPKVYLWPQPTNTGADCTIHYLRVRKLEDYDSANNTGDVMAPWIRPLKYLLAADLGDEFGMPDQWCMRVELKAQQLLKEAKAGNFEYSNRNYVASAHVPEN